MLWEKRGGGSTAQWMEPLQSLEMFVPPQQRPLGLSMDFCDACGAGVSSPSPLQGTEWGSWNRFLITSPQFPVGALASLLFATPILCGSSCSAGSSCSSGKLGTVSVPGANVQCNYTV